VAELRFSWDPQKARSNERKHGVSFEEAQTVFSDEHGLLLEDPDPDDPEERFVLIGLSSALRLLLVCHCLREGGESIRIISARRASKPEGKQYWERLRR
jgi:uncharacterized DUF497 family protein